MRVFLGVWADVSDIYRYAHSKLHGCGNIWHYQGLGLQRNGNICVVIFGSHQKRCYIRFTNHFNAGGRLSSLGQSELLGGLSVAEQSVLFRPYKRFAILAVTCVFVVWSPEPDELTRSPIGNALQAVHRLALVDREKNWSKLESYAYCHLPPNRSSWECGSCDMVDMSDRHRQMGSGR